MGEIKKQRITSIDVAKGIGILFVVAGHTMLYDPIHFALYSFSIRMPLFFMISGLFVNPQKYGNFGNFIKNKLKTLICPYVLFCAIGIVYFLFLNLLTGGKTLPGGVLDYIIKSVCTVVWAPGSHYFRKIDTPLWFVPCMFIMEIIYYFLSKIKDKRVFCTAVVLIVLLGWFSESKYCPVDLYFLPWNLGSACFALGFFVFGKLFYNLIKEKILTVPSDTKNNLKLSGLFILFLAISITASYFNGLVSLGSRILNNGFLFYILGITGALSVIIISKFAEKSRFLQFCGKNSFVIMAIHVIIDNFTVVVFKRIYSATHIKLLDFSVHTVFSSITRFIISAALSVVFALVYSKIKNMILNKIEKSREKA